MQAAAFLCPLDGRGSFTSQRLFVLLRCRWPALTWRDKLRLRVQVSVVMKLNGKYAGIGSLVLCPGQPLSLSILAVCCLAPTLHQCTRLPNTGRLRGDFGNKPACDNNFASAHDRPLQFRRLKAGVIQGANRPRGN
jgi:hypothetical protein